MEEAHRVFTFWRAAHYRAMYATVMEEEQSFQQIMAGSLTLPRSYLLGALDKLLQSGLDIPRVPIQL